MPSARRVEWAKFRITAVGIAAVAILSVLFYLLTGGRLLKENATLYVYVPDATGIARKSAVSVNGIDVGKVSAVALSGSNDPNRIVRLTLQIELEHLADIPADSTVQLSTESVVGDRYVDITRGNSPTHAQPNAELAYKMQPELLKTLDMAQFLQQLQALDATLSDIQAGRGRVGEFVTTDTLYNELSKRVDELESVIKKAASTTGMLGELTYTDRLYRKLREPLAALNDILGRIQAGQGPIGQLLYEDGQYAQIDTQLTNMRQSVAALRSNAFLQSDDLYTAWSGALASMIQSVDSLNRSALLVTSDIYDNLNGTAQQMRDTIRDFREHPQKYLRLNLSQRRAMPH